MRRRVCRALDFAHNFVAPGGQRLDIVHRDVSPGNIMASWDGHIKLADFGIAKARTSFDPAAERHILMGKKHYMSPEQALALAVDARTDVFTLGVVLYEMLTLEPLFKEDITDLLLDEVTVHPLPSVRARVPQLPGEIEDVLTRALSRDPEPPPDRRRHGPRARHMDRAPAPGRDARSVAGAPGDDLPDLPEADLRLLEQGGDADEVLELQARVEAAEEAGLLSRLFGL